MLDEALTAYTEAGNETAKQQSLAIIEALIAYGAKPSLLMIETVLADSTASKKLDWPVLTLLLKHLTLVTPFCQAVKQSLLIYTCKSARQLDSWYTSFWINEQTKNQRLADVQKFVMILCHPDRTGVELDHCLTAEILKRKKIAEHIDSSSLYKALNALMEKESSESLVVAMNKGPVEMKSLPPASFSKPDFKGLRFLDDTAAAPTTDTEEMPPDPRTQPEPARASSVN